MDLNLEIKEKGPSLTEPVSFMVTEQMKLEIQDIKRTSKRNQMLMNELMRQCLSQLITKFRSGEFDESRAS